MSIDREMEIRYDRKRGRWMYRNMFGDKRPLDGPEVKNTMVCRPLVGVIFEDMMRRVRDAMRRGDRGIVIDMEV
jgi:hypothetical protein